MSMPDDQETRSAFRTLLVSFVAVVFTVGLVLLCGYLGRWAPSGP
jgi:hypothetical protein